MAVYVDALMATLKSRKWPYYQGCHLTADTFDELHAFAARLGLRREWYQGQNTLPHYDLTASKRERAVRMGAVEITREQLVEQLHAYRAKKNLTASEIDPSAISAASALKRH